MSSKFKVLSIALVALMALSFYSATSKADVTGSFAIHLSYEPIQCQFLSGQVGTTFGITGFPDQPCEKTFFKIDFETAIQVNITISGLTMGIHAHTGVTGFEDIQLSFTTTLGALDINDLFVFAQPFAVFIIHDAGTATTDKTFDEAIPTCLEDAPKSGLCQTLFVKKRVTMTISLGGVTLTNLAMFEDVTFPNYCGKPSVQAASGCTTPVKEVDTGSTYNSQSGDQHFGFGDVITLSGQTPSGVTVTMNTGICAEQLVNAIKKHAWTYLVDTHCVGNVDVVKPPVLFSFESLSITGIPLTSNLTLSLTINCGSIGGAAELVPAVVFGPCNIKDAITITGGPIFNTITITSGFTDILGPATFSDIVVTASGGPLSLTMKFSPSTFLLTSISATASFTLNPDTNPANLTLGASGTPGLTSFSAKLSVVRAGLTFSATSTWGVTAGKFTFKSLGLALSASAGIVNVSGTVNVKGAKTGVAQGAFLVGGDIVFTVAF